jgi:DNA-binding NarL/FixJ family response regulator
MKILVTDDHALIRDALRGVLKQLRSDASVFEASDSRQAMRIIEDHPNLDLILLDLNLPDRDGFSVLADLRERYPAIAIVVLSALQDRRNVIRALDLGALGFIPKSTPREVMLSALQLVFSGGIYIPAEILGREETSLLQSPPLKQANDLARVQPTDLGLTARQIEVLALMAQGRTNKAISRTLDLAEPTVKNHITAILKALKASNRTEAVIAVGKFGWELPRVGKL